MLQTGDTVRVSNPAAINYKQHGLIVGINDTTNIIKVEFGVDADVPGVFQYDGSCLELYSQPDFQAWIATAYPPSTPSTPSITIMTNEGGSMPVHTSPLPPKVFGVGDTVRILPGTGYINDGFVGVIQHVSTNGGHYSYRIMFDTSCPNPGSYSSYPGNGLELLVEAVKPPPFDADYWCS